MDPIDTAKWEIIEAGGRTLQSFGLNRLFGQIFMLLYLSENALSLDELASQLSVSKASVSIACRQLEAWGALHRVWKKGDRRDYYMAETDIRHIVKNGLLDSLNKKLNSGKIQIQRSLDLLEQSQIPEDKKAFLHQRLQEAERYRSFASRLMNNPLARRLM